MRLSARKSTGTGPLTYSWNFHNGGKRVDATTKRVKIKYQKPGRKKVTLVVTDSTGQTDKRTRNFRVRAKPPINPAQRTYQLEGLETALLALVTGLLRNRAASRPLEPGDPSPSTAELSP